MSLKGKISIKELSQSLWEKIVKSHEDNPDGAIEILNEDLPIQERKSGKLYFRAKSIENKYEKR